MGTNEGSLISADPIQVECEQALIDARTNLLSTRATLDQCKHELQSFHQKHCQPTDRFYEDVTTLWLCEHRSQGMKEHLDRRMDSIKLNMMREQSDTIVIRMLEDRKQQLIRFWTILNHDRYKVECARIQLHLTTARGAKDLEMKEKKLLRLMMKAVETRKEDDVTSCVAQEILINHTRETYERWVLWDIENIGYYEGLAVMSRGRLEKIQGLGNARRLL